MATDIQAMVAQKFSPGKLINGLEGATVGDYWQWAYSDILCNTNRSILAEFVVGRVLGVVESPRIEWGAYDLYYNEKRIEVKCAAYLQSWPQNKLSTIQFDIAKKLSWDPKTGISSKIPERSSDCYVFCLYPEKDHDHVDIHIDILNIGSWDFYVVSTSKINEFGDQKRIGETSLKALCKPVKIDALKSKVNEVLSSDKSWKMPPAL